MERRSKEKVIPLEIYTDGSSKQSPDRHLFGGWAFVAVNDSKEIYYGSAGQLGATNQRMELEAIRQALKYAESAREPNQRVIVYSDSAYAINCQRQHWYYSWMNNGWVNSKGEPVANRDLWEEIIPYFDNFWYTFTKVAGHSGIYWNERCDKLAQGEAEKLKFTRRG